MANRKPEPSHTYTVCVVGLSGTEAVKGPVGVGKSCLCNRFVRPAADDFYPEHPSLLSAADFNGQVVNNDHFLYWGKASRIGDDGCQYSFHVVEQTEFLDDTTFGPLRSGRTDPYLKRCSQVKIQSAEKLMYICRDQLGLEDQFDMVTFPSGKVGVDGFVCVVDVSKSQPRSPETQLDFVTKILTALAKTKKPIVIATNKMDEGSDVMLQEVHKMVNRNSKEFKGLISIVEVSAISNVNVESAFLLLASLIDKSRTFRPKILSYSEASRLLEERMDLARQAYGSLLASKVQDYKITWATCKGALEKNPEFNAYVEFFGQRKAKSQFNNKVTQLRKDFITKRKAELLKRVPGILNEFFPNLQSISGRNWKACLEVIGGSADFKQRFVQTLKRWSDDDQFLESGDQRMPLDLMESQEVEAIFSQHVKALHAELQRQEDKSQFYTLMLSHPNVLAGAPLKEMDVYFYGTECYNRLSLHDRQEVYQRAQVELRSRARRDFLELLYERMDIFYKYDDPDKSITQEDVEALMDLLRMEPKCRAMSRCEEDRKVIMLNHLGFLQYPIKEQCPFRTNCMELSLQRFLSARHKRSQANPINNWTPNPDEKQINLLIVGADGLATDLVDEIRSHYEDDEYTFDDQIFSLDYRTIDGDVSLPHNSLKIPDFTAHGCILVYSCGPSLAFIRDTVCKTFLAPSDERLQYHGLPVVLLQALDSHLSEKAYLALKDEGTALATRMKCEFIDMPELIDMEESVDFNQFYENQVPRSMREIAIQLVNNDCIDSGVTHRAPFGDIRLLMCHMCADPYSLELVLQPFLAMQTCHVVTNDRYHVIQFDTFIADTKKKVEVILASYHEALLLREEFCHGYIMVYSAKRKASYSVIESFVSKIPRIPALMVAVNDSDISETDAMLTKKGHLLAQKFNCLFITTNDFHNQSPYTQLLTEVWHSQLSYQDDSNLMNSSLETSHNSFSNYENSPTDPYKASSVGYGGRRPYADSRAALYLGNGWMDNNDVYHRDRIHAPLADRIEMADYEEPADALSDSSDDYALVHDALPAGKIQRVHSTLKREFKPAFPLTDSESDLSSLERNTLNRSPMMHRSRLSPLMSRDMTSPHAQRRALSPMGPRPEIVSTGERKANSLPRSVVHRVNMDSNWDSNSSSCTQTMRSDTPSEGSESAGDEVKKSGGEVKRHRSLKALRLRRPDLSVAGDDDSGLLDRLRNTVGVNSAEKLKKRTDKKKQKDEEKLIKEKQKSVRRKLKSRLKRQSYLFKSSGMVLQDYVQEEGQLVPKFVELCVKFIESEGLLVEGIYRISGNAAHIELLKEMYAENRDIDIHSLDISVNGVAASLKKFFSDLLEPLIPSHLNQELVIADSIPENSSRLLALRGVIKKLPPANHEVLRYLATHLHKITLHSHINSMDSRNLAICWWPTIIRQEILTVEEMQRMSKAMQDVSISLIEQHGFFFYNEHEV